MTSFKGRTLLLTGAAGGIGREIAALFLAREANLVLADLDEAAVQDMARTLDPQGTHVVATRYDAGAEDEAAAIVTVATRHFGGIDFLVPGAGIYPESPLEHMTGPEWRKVITINLDSVFYLCRAAIPALRDGSAVVTMTSVAAHKGSQNHAHYSASKGAVLSLTRSLALELGARTRVNAVSPGIIDTAMTRDLRGQKGDALLVQTPLQRFGHPREVASVVSFLCSDDASFVNGEVIHVNGGLYIAG
ncbi:beta-ketoacyl-ACP reductase [Gluconacetobacter liquefaciens]|uniref:3-oxoacyl-[acyl-carrier protein] reductase n=1 Tax=Gluconacetobacter liquefaciens TaxID=89584 RepID=A0A370FZQ9_GLULI|nr:SDR family NAD(P)-dependent oxidoreductase [Gluconacetobacter liquefaciens]MBB2187018.1 SDR family oxidoreductase [Gluconacetobacter liquefaciens]RDI36992.1 3-oxoacyl-[acyl-carrier protein] reductase [Gluconacetobacter liquefaciens]GBR05610.1 dehydrogenase [Gluconacetobacter liquefaciens NRIC 0522]GEB38746.1 beta-ketoacyl-ACP reductase [Gluconacetobacter liquefaciens]